MASGKNDMLFPYGKRDKVTGLRHPPHAHLADVGTVASTLLRPPLDGSGCRALGLGHRCFSNWRVLDIADLFRGRFTLPIEFKAVKSLGTPTRDF